MAAPATVSGQFPSHPTDFDREGDGDDKETVSQVKMCQQQFGDEWVDEWLSRRGLTISQYVGEEEQLEERELAAV